MNNACKRLMKQHTFVIAN